MAAMLAIGSGDIISQSAEDIFRHPYNIKHGHPVSVRQRRRTLIAEAVWEEPHSEVRGKFKAATGKSLTSIIREIQSANGFPDAATSADITGNFTDSIFASLLVKFEAGSATRQLLNPRQVWRRARNCVYAAKACLVGMATVLMRKPIDHGHSATHLCKLDRALGNVELPQVNGTVPNPSPFSHSLAPSRSRCAIAHRGSVLRRGN